MSMAAPARYPLPGSGAMGGGQISEEEFEKLQEIHELINLMLKELPMSAQSTARPYLMSTPPMVPYTYSFYQFPWGRIPFVGPPGF